jgi:predicted ATPase
MTRPTDPTFITRVSLRNYKSIRLCAVSLGPLSFLVGPNGSGKSNFLDSMRFVANALRSSVEQALRERGGINEVRRRSGGHPNHFSVRLDFHLPDGSHGHYAFRIGSMPQSGFEVQDEECVVNGRAGDPLSRAEFRVRSGTVERMTGNIKPPAARDRLFLVNAAGLPEFRPVFDNLSHMGFYNLNPEAMRDLQPPDAGELLERDGRNIASVVGRLARVDVPRKERIEEYLSKVVPGVRGVDHKILGPKETLEFRQEVAGSKDPWRFVAANMSDGTVRVLGILAALFQTGNGSDVPLVGIEEPEIALHPGAAGVLLDGLIEASTRTQVIVTSHSPDLLDDPRIRDGAILAVGAEGGMTVIGQPDEAGRKVLLENLYTAGELLRLNQLAPDRQKVDTEVKQLALFELGGD